MFKLSWSCQLLNKENCTHEKIKLVKNYHEQVKLTKNLPKTTWSCVPGLTFPAKAFRQRERVSPSDRLRRTAYVQKVRFRIRQCISTLPAPHTTFIALFRVRMNGPLNTVDTKRVSVSYTR